MAVFKANADAELPILTQVMQLDLDSYDELLSLWRRGVLLGYVDPELDAELASKIFYPHAKTVRLNPGNVGPAEKEGILIPGLTDMAFIQDSWDPIRMEFTRDFDEKSEEREYLMAAFLKTCALAVKIVKSLYETDCVPNLALRELRKIAHDIAVDPKWGVSNEPGLLFPWSDVGKSQETIYAEGEVLVPLATGFLAVSDSRVCIPVFLVRDAIEDLFVSLLKRKARLLRCPQCNNIFVAQHGHTRYCSSRCSGIARQIRHKQKIDANDEIKILPFVGV